MKEKEAKQKEKKKERQKLKENIIFKTKKQKTGSANKKEQNEGCVLVCHNASSLNVKTGQQTLRCVVTGKRDGNQNEQDVQR